MEILILQVFVSLLLALGGVLLFLWSHKQADHEHIERLALFPIDDEERPAAAAPEPTRLPESPNP